jgi:hypothetical protein
VTSEKQKDFKALLDELPQEERAKVEFMLAEAKRSNSKGENANGAFAQSLLIGMLTRMAYEVRIQKKETAALKARIERLEAKLNQ